MNAELKYADLYESMFRNFKSDAEQIRQLQELAPDGPILEIGAGAGRTVGFITQRPHWLLEIDPDMLKHLHKKTKTVPGTKVFEGDARCLPLEDESVAVGVFAYGSIGEINPICVTLTEIYRCLKDNGLIYLQVLNPENYSVPVATLPQRKKLFSGCTYSITVNTIPVTGLGSGRFQTHLWARSKKEEVHHVISQYFPNYEGWKVLLDEIGFEIVSGIAGSNDVQTWNIVARKKVRKPIRSQQTSAVQNIYNKIAAHYNSEEPEIKYGVASWFKLKALDYLETNPVIVDLACGAGFVAKQLDAFGIKPYKLYGYDISSNMIERCNKLSLYTNALTFDAGKGLPGIAPMSINLVTAFGFFEFVEKPKIILSDISRILHFGGELLCSFESATDNIKETLAEFEGNQIRRFALTQNEIENSLEEAGFEISEISKSLGYVSPSSGISIEYFYVRAMKNRIV